MNNIIFIENKKYETQSDIFRANEDVFNKYGEKVGNEKFCFNFCGFVAQKDKIYSIMPKTYRQKSLDEDLYCIRVVYKALMRYKHEAGQRDPHEAQLLGNDGEDYNFIALAHDLISDFKKNGLVTRTNKRLSLRGNGSINWQKTVASITPIFVNNIPAYFKQYSKCRYSKQELIVRLHSYAVGMCLHILGWLIAPEIDRKDFESDMPCEKALALYTIQCELAGVYSDKEIRVLRLLLQYYSEAVGNYANESFSTFATPYFHIVWEKACRCIFKNFAQYREKMPKAFWRIEGNEKERVQIPDFISFAQESYLIIDAKYYDISCTLPGWPDLVKQFFYKATFSQGQFCIKNIMLFPHFRGELFLCRGYAYLESGSFGQIAAVSVDLIEVLYHYSKYNEHNFEERLFSSVPWDELESSGL